MNDSKALDQFYTNALVSNKLVKTKEALPNEMKNEKHSKKPKVFKKHQIKPIPFKELVEKAINYKEQK